MEYEYEDIVIPAVEGDPNDYEIIVHEMALAVLLAHEELMATYQGRTIELYLICNDVFLWAAADCMKFSYDDIGPIFKAFHADKTWGTAKWACKRRNMQPQPAVIKAMKANGSWDAEMEALPVNVLDKPPQP